MRVLIMGSGAVGGAYGALLAQRGHDVTFVARGQHLAAMRERGLELRRPNETIHLQPARAVGTPAEAGGESELILFTVKGYDTSAAIEALRPVVGANTTVLTLQNGVDSPDHLAAAFGAERVLAGTTTINGAVPEPGVIEERGVPIRTTIAELSGEVTPRLETVSAALREIDGEVVVSRDPRLALWQKFVILAPHGTITSACGESLGAIRSVPEGAALYRQLIEETVAVGRAAGVALPDDIAENTYKFIMAMPPVARSSLAIDFAAGKRVELEQITGAIVRRSQQFGAPAPGFHALYAVLKARAIAAGVLSQ